MTPKGSLVEIPGTRLYVYTFGDSGTPALLYLHGGPGMGCHEFARWQGEALGRRLHVTTFDQRGTNQSDPVDEQDPLTEELIVEDCEALRTALGIDSWFVIGHSFGGRVATRYAAKHPVRVRGVLFDSPSWDLESTERYRLPKLAEIYEEHGASDQAARCRALAAGPDLFADGYPVGLLGGLHEFGQAWYLHDRSNGALVDDAGVAPRDRQAGNRAAERLINDPGMFEDLLPMLGTLRMPVRLVRGEADLVTSPAQIEAFVEFHGEESVETVESAGHFVQAEQPERYTRLVWDFVSEACAAGA